ncbi:hypothetical protein EC9_41500 [Rosistilla ulvae]|uniref:Uncharacterized protein n=1 Tax=Rosistilla ulvae TaxID=1930277 RepID=A0A517M4Z8_9BACT|nr:hypothetical protein EC9_41500 [Rosistilla ulvae]
MVLRLTACPTGRASIDMDARGVATAVKRCAFSAGIESLDGLSI